MTSGRIATPIVAAPSHKERLSSLRGLGVRCFGGSSLGVLDGAVRTVKITPAIRPTILPKQNTPNASSGVMARPDDQRIARGAASPIAAIGKIDAADPIRPRPRKIPIVSSEYTRLTSPTAAKNEARKEWRSTPDIAATIVAAIIIGQAPARIAERMIG
jgi:hypothetical protein